MENIELLFNASIYDASREQNEFKEMLKCQIEKLPDEKYNSKKTTQILIELFQTEVSYILHLELLIKYFLLPLSTSRPALLSKKYLDIIFNNTLQVYNVNKELYLAIKGNPTSIAKSYSTFAPFLKLYSIYAYGYKYALSTLEEQQKKNKKLLDFIKSQESRPEVAATLISLLIAPIQRVPRYRLLLQSLINEYSPQHPDLQQTQDALVKVEETANHINRLITDAEEGEELVNLAKRLGTYGDSIVLPGRKILKQGIVRKTSKKGDSCHVRFLVLFTDGILLCKGDEKGALTSPKLYPLVHMNVSSVLGSSLFRIVSGEDDILLQTATPDRGHVWINHIQDAIDNYITNRRTLRKESSKRTRQSRLVEVSRTTASVLRRARRICKLESRPSCLTRIRKLRRNALLETKNIFFRKR